MCLLARSIIHERQIPCDWIDRKIVTLKWKWEWKNLFMTFVFAHFKHKNINHFFPSRNLKNCNFWPLNKFNKSFTVAQLTVIYWVVVVKLIWFMPRKMLEMKIKFSPSSRRSRFRFHEWRDRLFGGNGVAKTTFSSKKHFCVDQNMEPMSQTNFSIA